jgi:FkbM family methyltransferase
MNRDSIFALTSISPAAGESGRVKDCLKSWRQAGLEIRSFNHPTEIPGLAANYDVDFVPVTETSQNVFGRHLVPIKAMLDWAANDDCPALLINSDIELRLASWEMSRLRWLADGGLCYFVRYNHNGRAGHAVRERFGIDAFLLHGRDAAMFPKSFLSMGKPFWDYWIPHTFVAQHRSIRSVEFAAAFHRQHPSGWSWEDWHRCGIEFDRITGVLNGNHSFDNCLATSAGVRRHFERQRTSLSRRPGDIRNWVQRKFRYRGPKLFLELGAHQGTDTSWLAQIPDVIIHAFEPDPRNQQPARDNVTPHHAAVADRNGRGWLIPSLEGWGREWTYSSSIKRPKNHLLRFPVTFGEAIEVDLVALDTFSRNLDLGVIDFIWADIQGAEGEMIRGGLETLRRTRYLYTEYSDDELYENQATLSEILDLLEDFRVLELWPGDVLLENRKFSV